MLRIILECKLKICLHSFLIYHLIYDRRAKFYSDWEKKEGREGWVCAVWVKDYDIWMNKVNKVLFLFFMWLTETH